MPKKTIRQEVKKLDDICYTIECAISTLDAVEVAVSAGLSRELCNNSMLCVAMVMRDSHNAMREQIERILEEIVNEQAD